MKLGEARRALGEMRVQLSAEHAREVEEKLAQAERDGAGSAASSGSVGSGSNKP
ncbi:MAG: hypothetical protein QM756_45310 [Polyangiaceae bacterium]